MPANKSSISKNNSLEKMGEFWDKHDFTEFDDPNARDVDFDVTAAVPKIHPWLFSASVIEYRPTIDKNADEDEYASKRFPESRVALVFRPGWCEQGKSAEAEWTSELKGRTHKCK